MPAWESATFTCSLETQCVDALGCQGRGLLYVKVLHHLRYLWDLDDISKDITVTKNCIPISIFDVHVSKNNINFLLSF